MILAIVIGLRTGNQTKKYRTMKLILITAALLATFASNKSFGQKGKISNDERTFILDYLKITEDNLLETLINTSEEQWNYKPANGGWSVAQCMEHIIIAENAVFQQLKTAMAAEADHSLNTKHEDGWLLAKVSDRGVKVNTPLPPASKTIDRNEMMVALKDSRKTIRNYLEDKSLPLRTHFGKSPYGPADGYQLLIVIAAHSMRHHAQILEVLNELAN